ncbi:hypothetical protein ZWY2020_047086 [Hordeum vulgare]|nr:hypothetical protein ZWY2020_047086 [Hordeum vulgare]
MKLPRCHPQEPLLESRLDGEDLSRSAQLVAGEAADAPRSVAPRRGSSLLHPELLRPGERKATPPPPPPWVAKPATAREGRGVGGWPGDAGYVSAYASLGEATRGGGT